METKYGVVLRVDDGRAIVRIDNEDTDCGGCRSCPLKSLCQTRDPGHMDLAIPIEAGKAPNAGDKVRVEYEAANRAVAGVVLFLPALAGLLAGGVITQAVWPGRDGVFLAGCGIGLALGVVCTYLLSRFSARLRPVAKLGPSIEK